MNGLHIQLFCEGDRAVDGLPSLSRQADDEIAMYQETKPVAVPGELSGFGVDGSEIAVARSQNGGQTYPFVSFFSFASGSDHFNDKPMITVDTTLTSKFRDNVYVAWDAFRADRAQAGFGWARLPTMAEPSR